MIRATMAIFRACPCLIAITYVVANPADYLRARMRSDFRGQCLLIGNRVRHQRRAGRIAHGRAAGEGKHQDKTPHALLPSSRAKTASVVAGLSA